MKRAATNKNCGSFSSCQSSSFPLPQRHYTYVQCLTDQEIAFEKWDGSSVQTQVKDGIDFFLIREGHIQLQLIYYKPAPI